MDATEGSPSGYVSRKFLFDAINQVKAVSAAQIGEANATIKRLKTENAALQDVIIAAMKQGAPVKSPIEWPKTWSVVREELTPKRFEEALTSLIRSHKDSAGRPRHWSKVRLHVHPTQGPNAEAIFDIICHLQEEDTNSASRLRGMKPILTEALSPNEWRLEIE